jgi:antitoxin CptB
MPAVRRSDAWHLSAGNSVDAIELNRLRWRCRRGMLENDLVLSRYVEAAGASLSDVDVAALSRLLDLSDNDLWELLSGRLEPADAADAPLVERLRAV